MNQFQKKEIIQAVLVADDVELLRPISSEMSTTLIPLVNVPLIDYALESFNRSGIEEVFIFLNSFVGDVRKHIKQRFDSNCSWTVDMKVHTIGVEGSRCLGDALRDLDVKGLIRGYFILMGADTITNTDFVTILEEHKKTAKFDKGTALTIVLKEESSNLRTGDQVIIARDAENNRLHFHQRIKQNSKEKNIKIPLETFLNNSDIVIHHNLIDPQISICSPSLLSLFSDNFDFENRDDFIRGLLINEEILDSRIYVHLLSPGQYARKVTDWITYQIISNDVINRWVYPLVPDMGICCLSQHYIFLRNNIYKSPKSHVSKVIMKENVVVEEESSIDIGSEISSTVIGKNCKIGKNCILKNSFLFDNVVLGDNCILENCVVSHNVVIGEKSKLSDGTVIGANVVILENSNLSGKFLQKDGEMATNEEEILYTSDSEEEQIEKNINIPKMGTLTYNYEESDYNSSSEGEEESRAGSPALDDANIFFSEVVDSLTRSYQEKSNPEFLILEINSSRYAYNMTLKEVNFYVIKALFSLLNVNDESSAGTVLQDLLQILKYFGTVITNYIKTEDSMADCLKAIEESINQDRLLKEKATQIIHYFYDKEFVSEEAIIEWYENLSEESIWLRESLKKLIEWLTASSSEDE